MRKLSKNAIIIIGNGFDLAHNMKTSYNDFSNYYIREIITKKLIRLISNPYAPEFNSFFDGDFVELIRVFKDPSNYNREDKSRVEFANSKKIGLSNPFFNFFDFIKEIIDSVFSDDKRYSLINKVMIAQKSIVKEIIKNEFLGKLYNNEYENWFDIERAYFHELKTYVATNNKVSAKKLNDDFEEIKNGLKKYLLTVKEQKLENINTFFTCNFLGKENIYVINFNYTKTFDAYKTSFIFNLRKEVPINVEVNYIHGTLDKDIIFGYGDDTSQEYQEIKDKDYNEYLKNFKTPSYLLTDNYIEIINKIDSFNDYEAYVIGHSLGRTDKTLLKEIFDNEKCLNIHIFKRVSESIKTQKELYKLLTYNISRIINKENDLRKKVVSFSSALSFPFPQDYLDDIHAFEKDFKNIYFDKKNIDDLFLYH